MKRICIVNVVVLTKERALSDWFFSYFHKNGLVRWCKTNHFVGGVFSLHTGCWLSKTDTVGTCSKHQSQKGVHFSHIGSTYANFLEKKKLFTWEKSVILTGFLVHLCGLGDCHFITYVFGALKWLLRCHLKRNYRESKKRPASDLGIS